MTVASASELRQVSIDIEGMTCSACSSRLERAFSKHRGIAEASVNLPLETATLYLQPAIASIQDVVELVRRTGYDVGIVEENYRVEHLRSAQDVARVQNALTDVPGVVGVDVDLVNEQVSLEYYSRAVNQDRLVDVLRNVGFQLISLRDLTGSSSDSEESNVDKLKLIISCVVCIPFLIQMFAQFLGWEEIHLPPAGEVSLATLLMVLVGPRFYRSAYAAIRHGSANMDVLVSIGTTCAYLYSWYKMATLGEAAEGTLYFEATAIILTLVLIGKRLETRAKSSASSAVRELLELRPQTVRVVMSNEEVIERPVSLLREGDRFESLAGDVFPADGTVIQGTAMVDESLVTGESTTLRKIEADEVLEGTVNVDGHLVVRATNVGQNSTLQKIIKMIEGVQGGKLGVQRLVDQVCGWFVPVVLGFAFVVFCGWLLFGAAIEIAVLNAVAVLVIACPCALGLATPTAVVAGVGAAAKHGIIFKDLEALEHTHKVNSVVFDKTGTVTDGKPKISSATTLSTHSEDRCLQIAASLQQHSTHPLASSFLSAASQKELSLYDVEEFRSSVGRGIQGRIEGMQCVLGSKEWVGESVSASEHPQTPDGAIVLAIDQAQIAYFETEESVRAESSWTLDWLRNSGRQTVLLSGDTDARANVIGGQLGFDQVYSSMLPDEKVARVQEMQREGQFVAMVGDGVNDAPALRAANVGIAINSGISVSSEAASVSLMRLDLSLVPAAISASEVTLRKIKENLLWAFGYNVLMLPVAAMGFLSPTLAGLAMSLSSVSVVLNSLWLRRWRPNH